MDQARLAYLTPWPGAAVFLSLALRNSRRYFQGVGGSGAPPFFQGVGGSGAPPFFHGVGGSGAPPFAIITEPSPCVTTTVFRLIAPTSTSMARKITVSLRDIVPPRCGKNPGGSLYVTAPMSSSSGYEPVSNRYTLSLPIVSISLRLPDRWDSAPIPCRIGFGIVWVNGTVVLKIIELTRPSCQAEERTARRCSLQIVQPI
jgi:hypothetical protein